MLSMRNKKIDSEVHVFLLPFLVWSTDFKVGALGCRKMKNHYFWGCLKLLKSKND